MSELADRLEKLLENAPPRPWFRCDDLCYLHFAKDGKLPEKTNEPWNYPVVGRFDYGAGAMELIEFIGNNTPEIIAALRKP